MADLERNRNRLYARRLNDIPEDIFIHILTFLPTHDAVRSCILSQKWRNLWSSVPSINFDYELFPHTPDDTSIRLASFIDRTLLCRSPFPINKFRLQFDSRDYIFVHVVESWIKYAISHNVIELDIDFCNKNPFELRLSSLKGSQVRDLKLFYCDLIFPSNTSSLKLDSIRSLYLFSIYLGDQMVVDLMSACVNLESLTIKFCYGMRRLRICSSKLKELSLGHFDPGPPFIEQDEEELLEISCPDLRYISIAYFKIDNYCIKNSTSLVEAEVSHFDEYSGGFSHWSKVVRLFSDVKSGELLV